MVVAFQDWPEGDMERCYQRYICCKWWVGGDIPTHRMNTVWGVISDIDTVLSRFGMTLNVVLHYDNLWDKWM